MRAVAISDIHLDAVTNGGHSRYHDVCVAIDEAIDFAANKECTHFFFLGDAFDPDAGAVAYRCVEKLLSSATSLAAVGIESHWLAGNHDVIEDGSGSTVLTPLLAFDSIDLFDASIVVHNIPSVQIRKCEPWIIALPFTASSHSYDPSAVIDSVPDDEPAIILSHLMISGIMPGDESKQMSRGRDIWLPKERISRRTAPTLVLNGHYHKRQEFENINIVGSLVSLNFCGDEPPTSGFRFFTFLSCPITPKSLLY